MASDYPPSPSQHYPLALDDGIPPVTPESIAAAKAACLAERAAIARLSGLTVDEEGYLRKTAVSIDQFQFLSAWMVTGKDGRWL